MNAYLSDTLLDDALANLLSGETLSEILATHPAQSEALGPMLNAVLQVQTIKPVEFPSTETLLANRNAFLAHISELQLERQSVGRIALETRFRSLFFTIANLLKGWWLSSAGSPRIILVRAIAILLLVLAIGHGTLVSAGDSLPNSPLYPLKLVIEETRLKLTRDHMDEARLYASFAGQRVHEIVQVIESDQPPNKSLIDRLSLQSEMSLQSVAYLSDEELADVLLHILLEARSAERQLAHVSTLATGPSSADLELVRQILVDWIELAQLGLEAPSAFRQRLTNGQKPGREEFEESERQEPTGAEGNGQRKSSDLVIPHRSEWEQERARHFDLGDRPDLSTFPQPSDAEESYMFQPNQPEMGQGANQTHGGAYPVQDQAVDGQNTETEYQNHNSTRVPNQTQGDNQQSPETDAVQAQTQNRGQEQGSQTMPEEDDHSGQESGGHGNPSSEDQPSQAESKSSDHDQGGSGS